jgi:hypothetical protein
MKEYVSGLFVIFLLTLVPTAESFAYTPKEGNVSAILGLGRYRTRFSTPDSGVDAANMGALSLMAIGDVSDHGSLELGIFFMNKIYLRELDNKFIAEKTQVMHITMGYRRWWAPYLSSSVSFYSSYSMGDLETVHNDFGADRPDTSATDKVEYGCDLALQGEFWSQDRLALIGDIRYSRSVTPKDHEDGDHYGVLIGIRYFIQEKQHVAKPQ